MKMALLKSVDNIVGLDYYEYRDSTFYNKYEYRMRVDIPCVRYTWWCKTTEDLDKKISGKTKKYGSVKKSDLSTLIQHQDALKIIINLQADRKTSKDLGVRIESETLAVFSNDLNKLHDIAKQLGSVYDPKFTQVQTAQYAGVKHFVDEPKHKYRVYLRSKRVDDNFHNELRDTIARLTSLHPSSALRQWMDRDAKRYGIWHFRWTSAAHFIDYDDESTLSYLALMHGDLLGKKYKLEKRPDPI
jgi:hypothetical protein